MTSVRIASANAMPSKGETIYHTRAEGACLDYCKYLCQLPFPLEVLVVVVLGHLGTWTLGLLGSRALVLWAPGHLHTCSQVVGAPGSFTSLRPPSSNEKSTLDLMTM